MKLIYIGSELRKNLKMQSALETMTGFFSEFAEIKTASSFMNPFLKMMHSTFLVLINRKKTNIILIDVFSTKSLYYSFWISTLCKVMNLKYVLILGGGGLPARYERSPRLLGSMFRNSARIVAPSNYLKHFFELRGLQVDFIPNIIDDSLYKFQRRSPLKPKILYLRGFGDVYNPLMLLRAVNELKYTKDLEVLMLGSKSDNHYDDVVAFIRNNGLEKIVKIEEKKTREEWISVSKDFSFMVSCPDIDNTPTSLIEGAALGLCVISTRVGGVPYMVSNDEIFLVNKNDHQELADLLGRLIDMNDEYHEKVINAFDWSSKFHWNIVKRDWFKLFTEVIRNA